MGYVNLHKLTWWLTVLGGLDWLLFALISKDVVDLLGLGSGIGHIVYFLVGLSALYQLFTHK